VRFNADELRRFGEALGRELLPPAILGFSGDLGAGKTTLIQAICRGAGAVVMATSPTYALVHESTTAAGVPLYHVDCYRLRVPAEARDLGFDDMIRAGAIILIEWPERAGAWLPPLDRHFRLAYVADPEYREVEEIR
jgi:tRNA threonylcarbamoyladenosine biosynthesis protein TsaE